MISCQNGTTLLHLSPPDFGKLFRDSSLALLAYLVHTVIDLMDDRFRTLLHKIGSRERLFDDIVTLTTFLCFKSWTALLDFMLVGLERRHQADEIELWVAK